MRKQIVIIFKLAYNISFTTLYRKTDYITFTSSVSNISLSTTKWRIHSTTFDFSKDDDARDRAYSPAIGSAFASHPFLIRRITKRARVTGAREQVANASSFIARAKRIVSKRAGRARRLDALRLVGPPWKSISNSPRNPVLSRKVNYIRRGELVEELAGEGKKWKEFLETVKRFCETFRETTCETLWILDRFPFVHFCPFFFFFEDFEIKFPPPFDLWSFRSLYLFSIDSDRNGERVFLSDNNILLKLV